MRLVPLLCIAGLVTGCGDNSEVGPDDLTVTPNAVTLAIGETATVNAAYRFGTTDTPADDVTWTTSNAATATVAANGGTATITAHAGGSAIITATGQGLSATVSVAVSDASLTAITITPVDPSIAAGTQITLVATATYSDTSTADVTATATWTSSNPTVATVAAGAVSGLVPGDATITAAIGEISGETALTVTDATLVSIAITPAAPSVALGIDPQLTATGTFSDSSTQDLTTQVTWSSSDTAVATIDAAGLAETLAVGTTTITATSGTVNGTTDLTVTAAVLQSIEVTPFDPSVALGLAQQFAATGHYSDGSTPDLTTQVTWASSAPSVATIDAAGLATTVAVGATTISATFAGVTGSSDLAVTPATLDSIAVTPADPSVALGVDPQFTATGHYSDGSTPDLTTQVLWESSATAVAQISNAAGSEGLATTLTTGATTISATLAGVSGTTQLTVTAATLDSITIAPATVSVALGLDPQFTATGHYSDGSTPDLTTQVTWASDATTVATISNAAGSEGLATTLATGTAGISATLDGVTGTASLTVTDATLDSIAVTPASPTVALGATPQFTATGHYSDGSTPDITTQVTWASSDTAVAQVSNAIGSEGVATTLVVGTTTISATLSGVTGATDLTVEAAPPAPTVDATAPADGATGVSKTTAIAVTFSLAMAPATITTQAADGACSGTLQLSADAFATCIGLGAPVWSAGDTIATATPAAALAYATTYQIRVLGSVTSAAGTAMGAPYTQAAGFTTEPLPACLPSLLVSQVYGGGGNSGAPYNADFIELFNPTLGPLSTGGMALQYGSSAGTTWQATPLPTATIPAGGYYLMRISAVGANGAPIGEDAIANPAIAMGGSAGKVALTSTTAALVGACPTGGTIVDFVGYGGANCFEGTAPTGLLSNTTAAIRAACTDTNNNAADFAVAAPSPRSSATPAAACACQ